MISELLRVASGPVDLAAFDPDGKPGFDGGKSDGKSALQDLADPLSDQQERLFANGRAAADNRRILLVLQGMDTSGKGGVMRHAAVSSTPRACASGPSRHPPRRSGPTTSSGGSRRSCRSPA